MDDPDELVEQRLLTLTHFRQVPVPKDARKGIKKKYYHRTFAIHDYVDYGQYDCSKIRSGISDFFDRINKRDRYGQLARVVKSRSTEWRCKQYEIDMQQVPQADPFELEMSKSFCAGQASAKARRLMRRFCNGLTTGMPSHKKT